jgi:hypothetical protein
MAATCSCPDFGLSGLDKDFPALVHSMNAVMQLVHRLPGISALLPIEIRRQELKYVETILTDIVLDLLISELAIPSRNTRTFPLLAGVTRSLQPPSFASLSWSLHA